MNKCRGVACNALRKNNTQQRALFITPLQMVLFHRNKIHCLLLCVPVNPLLHVYAGNKISHFSGGTIFELEVKELRD